MTKTNVEEIDIKEKIEIYQEAQKENNKEIFCMDLKKMGINSLRWISVAKIEREKSKSKK